MFIRLFLIVAILPLQSCSNTLIGEKLESSFDNSDSQIISGNTPVVKEQKQQKVISKLRSSKIDNNKAIIEALPPSNRIVIIEEKIIISDKNFTIFTFELNVK